MVRIIQDGKEVNAEEITLPEEVVKMIVSAIEK